MPNSNKTGFHSRREFTFLCTFLWACPYSFFNEIAEYIGVSKETIYRWLDQKKITAHRIGKQWKFKI